MNYTPLHYAAKSGNDVTTKLVLDNMRDAKGVNATGHRLKTPLHKARTPKIVKLLVDQGGKSIMYSKVIKKVDGEGCYENNEGCKCLPTKPRNSTITKNEMTQGNSKRPAHSAFSTLLNRNDKTAEVILDQHITDNGEELDSSDLVVVYDMKVFQNELTRAENKDSARKNTENQEKFGIGDEMALHSKIRMMNSHLLMHPLSTVFLSLKWSCVARSYYRSLMYQMIFVLSLSSVTIFQTYAVDKNETTKAICMNASNEGYNEFNEGCYLPEIIAMISPTHALVFHCIYGLLLLCTVYFFTDELVQAAYNWKHWSKSSEDILDFILVLITAFYAVGVYAFSISSLRHVAAWSTFGGWVKMILMLGKLPRYGKYVHMFVIVSKMTAGYMCVYSPAVLAFSLAFYILLSSSTPFMNPLNALKKTMVMLIGEIDYEDNFLRDQTLDYRFEISTQVLFTLFLLFGCVVLMNLLVGLAVDEIDVLREEGAQIRHGNFVDEMLRLEDLFVKKPRVTDCLPVCCGEKMREKISLFSKLNRKHPKNDLKLCVRPFEPKKKEANDQDTSWLKCLPSIFMKCPGSESSRSASENTVYFYNEKQRRPEVKLPTGIKISKAQVKDTLDWLAKRDEEKKKEKAKTETDSGLGLDADDLIKIKNNIQKIMTSLKINNDDDEC